MQHKTGEDRNQMFMFSLESVIASDSFVRVVDAFVEAIDLKSFGFAHVECQEEGRPPYHPSVLMKLYLYGYRYGIRTSRKLERETQTNIEAMWLLSGLRPKYKTIADFRKHHSKAFREVFRRFVCLLKEWDLIEGETVAIDSFKIRGSNSLKNNFNDKKLKRHLAYIDAQISEYESMLDSCGQEEDKRVMQQKIEERKEKQSKYEHIQKELEASGEEQISLTDPDSRAVILLRNIVNVGYNIQAPSTKDIGLYPISMFKYDKDKDTYICPQGSIMTTNGRWYRHSESRRRKSGSYQFQRYTTADCKTCENRHLCTQSKANGRVIDRSEYADITEANAKRVNENPEYYRQRQQITEHMFGTLKRQRGFTHVLVRGKEKVLGEVGLMFIGYNLTRCISILGTEKLIKALRECCLCIFKPKYWLILSPNNEFYYFSQKIAA